MIRPLADAEARRAIREDLDTSLVVEAAAGTGKTTELVARIIAVLRTGRGTLGRMVAVTFTEKAAGEMKLRLRAELERARHAEGLTADERQRLDHALGELETARIGTIHALCADLLHERPVEAEVDPIFGVSGEGAGGTLYQRAFDGWFQAVLENPPEGVRRILRRPRYGGGRSGPREMLSSAGWQLIENRDFQASWRRPAFDREALINDLLPRVSKLGGYATVAFDDTDYLAKGLRELKRFSDELEAQDRARGGPDYDGIEAQLRVLAKARSWRWRGRGRYYGQGLLRDDVVAERDELKTRLDAFCDASGADLAACLREDLRGLVERYETLKERAGELDFLDLLLRTRDLIRGDRTVRSQLQERFTHLFVDEFQDTDPLQAEILLLLAADDPAETDWTRARPVGGKLLLVGDPKQSIYRFRRADVALYESTKRRLMATGAKLVHLSTSFRGVRGVQAVVNHAFEAHMQGGPSQAAYVALSQFRTDHDAQPSVVALPVPHPYSDWGRVTAWAVNNSLPDAAGGFIQWLVEASGWTVLEDGERVPVRPRHVCLLFRRFQAFGEDITRPYVRAMEHRGIPHVLVGGHSFHGRDEVLAVRNALTAVEWPDDELSVYATLRGPLFAVQDDALLAYRETYRRLDPLRAHPDPDEGETPEPEVAEVIDALSILGRLHRGRNRRPVADTIAQVLEATRAHAGVMVWPTGEQALANVLRLMDLARSFEAGGATSFRAFVERLHRDAERGEAGDAPIVEEGTEGVRLMTVHRAKGLEFPVVILCDPCAPRSHDKPSRHTDSQTGLWAGTLAGNASQDLIDHTSECLRRDDEEGVRLAYVAATRARDLLVVPTCGDEPIAGWFDVLNPAIYPALGNRRAAQPAPGCPEFGPSSVVGRPSRARVHPGSSVAPGLHRPEVGDHTVVWWDPNILPAEPEKLTGLRHQRVLEQDDAGVGDESIAAHDAWLAEREEDRVKGEHPTWPTITATALAHDEARLLDVAEVAVERSADARGDRPHGKRFGNLVHAVLADAPFDADEATLQALASAQGRLLMATDDEVAAAAASAGVALAHPLMRRAAQSPACHREHPIAQRLDDGTLLEGIVDLAFREDTERGPTWMVVDFKSDLGLPEEARLAYSRQVTLYCRAITAATGQPARGALLLV